MTEQADNPAPEEQSKQPERRPVGRPTKYDPSMCEAAIAVLSNGESLAAVCAELKINIDTLNEWRKDNPQFSGAIKEGLHNCQRWWEAKYMKHMIENPGGSKLNTTGWIFMMKNRFRDTYADQPQIIAVKTDDTKIPEEIRDKLNSLEAKIRDSGKR